MEYLNNVADCLRNAGATATKFVKGEGVMKHLSVLIKPASALCNIRCSYCFYADVSSMREVRSFGRMLPETAEQMLASIYKELEDGDQLTLAFQGGEPTIAGLAYLSTLFLLQKYKKRASLFITRSRQMVC